MLGEGEIGDGQDGVVGHLVINEERDQIQSMTRLSLVPTLDASSLPMSLLAQAEANPANAEQILRQILAENTTTTDPAVLRDKETALVKLGQLYRDQKCVVLDFGSSLVKIESRNASSLAGVITLSRSFMSSTAKAKTAKLSTHICYLSLSPTSHPIQSEPYSTFSPPFQTVKKSK